MYCIGDKVVHPMHGAGIIKDMKKSKFLFHGKHFPPVCNYKIHARYAT